MKKVYIITSESEGIIGAFSTHEHAWRYLDHELDPYEEGDYIIEELVVDEKRVLIRGGL